MFERRFACIIMMMILTACMAGGAMAANILFISSLEEEMMPGDDSLKAFMEGLGHTVTYLDDDENAADTQAAAMENDLVFISESCGSAKVQLELTAVEKPIVTCEAWAAYEMGLGYTDKGGYPVLSPDITIVAPDHPLAAGFSGTIPVVTELTGDRGDARIAAGQAGAEATVIARVRLEDEDDNFTEKTFDAIWVYEKGATLPVPPLDGSPREAADIRIVFGLDEQSYLLWNENAFALLNASLNFGLGIRLQPEAYSPQPANNQKEVERQVTLGWKKGMYGQTHQIYFGTNFDDVNEATQDDQRGVYLGQTLDNETTFPLSGLLDYDQTYYWRVDEVNAAPDNTAYKGDIWTFTVLNFLVVDNFEQYTDTEPDRIFETWTDGWSNSNANGAVVGHTGVNVVEGDHYAETRKVHRGEQSMPLSFDNNGKYSEAYRAMPAGMTDWTQDGVESLVMWFMGHPIYLGGFEESPVGTFKVTGAGADIYDNDDQGHFAYKEFEGSLKIVAKVESVDNPEGSDGWSKAGIMVRESLDADSINTGLFATPENGVRFQFRATTQGSTDREFDPNAVMPVWLRLERTSGGLVRAYYSADGNQWTRFSIQQIRMAPGIPYYAGLAVTSHNPGVAVTGTFTNVEFDNANDWMDTDIGLTSNGPLPIYMAVDGKPVYFDNGDPNATINETWTQFKVPLQDFADQGVDLTNVQDLAIGVGVKGDASSGPAATGLLYIDDIRLYRP